MKEFVVSLLCFIGTIGGTLGDCGSLKAHSVYEGNKAVGRIRLYPSDRWKPFIRKGSYQWVKEKPKPVIVAFWRNGMFFKINETDDISENNYTLEIRGMKASDENSYVVECFTEDRVIHNRTEPVWLRLPTSGTTTSIFPTSSSKMTVGFAPLTPGPAYEELKTEDNTSVIVVIVMSFIIVTLVVVILALVIRMKVKSRQTRRDGRLIAKEEEEMQPSESLAHQGENVYNEIDDYAEMDPDITYAQVKDTALFTSQTNLTPGFSPSLPKRDHGVSKSMENIIASSQTELNSRTSKAHSIQDLYAKVIPKSERGIKNKDDEVNDSKTNEQNVGDASLNKTVVKKPQRSTLKRGGYQYKSMDCISTELPPEDALEFSNTLPRSFRRKGSRSTKELVYIEIDHGETASISNDYELEPQVIGEPPNAQYVSIDFDKKAFVAPIRKAPSSWYRKRQERKERKKHEKK